MPQTALKPQFIVDASGKKSGVILNMKDFKKLLAAWEDAQDVADYDEIKQTAKSYMTLDELKRKLGDK